MFVPTAAEVVWLDSVADGTQPVTTMGTSIVPGINTYSVYVTVMAAAAVTSEAFGFWINVNSIASSGNARDALMTIGVDPSGGTTFIDWVKDLEVACAGSYIGAVFGTGIWLWVPLRIPTGSTIAAKVSVNGASAGASRVRVVLATTPKNPETLKIGSYAVTYGSTPASSAGTAITPGTTSEGAWTQVGTVAAGDRPWFWHVLIGVNNATMVQALMHVDLSIGDATNKRVVIANQNVWTTTSETLTAVYAGAAAQAQPGDGIFVRAQSSVAITNVSAVAVGVC